MRKSLALITAIIISALSWAEGTQEETLLFGTSFQTQDGWTSQTVSSGEQTVNVTTGAYPVTFTLSQVKVAPTNRPSSMSSYTGSGYIQLATKGASSSYVQTSAMPYVTKVTYTHATTTSGGGWGLQYSMNGEEWTTLQQDPCAETGIVDTREVQVNLPNVMLRWYPLSTSNINSYLMDVDVYGMTIIPEGGDGGNTAGGQTGIERIYCRMTYEWWATEDAAVGLYAYADGDVKNAEWPGERMSKVEGEEGLWFADVDRSLYTNIIFTRVNGSGTIADWGAKTADLTIPTDGNNLYTITSAEAVWGDPGVEGVWSYYDNTAGTGGVTITGYSLVGDSALFGGAEWDVTNEATNMTQTGDFTWMYTLDSVYLKAYRNYEYKVVANHTWGISDYPSGGENYTLAVEQSGIYRVTFTFETSVGCTPNAELIRADESGGENTNYSNYAAVINLERMVQFVFSGTDEDDMSQYEAHVQLNQGDTLYIRDRLHNVMLEFTVEEYGAYTNFTYTNSGSNYDKIAYVVCQQSGCYDLFYKSNYSLYLGEGTDGCSEGEPYDEGSMQTAHVSLYGDYGYVYINDNVSSGDFVLGSTITLSAQPYSNYQFLEWSDGNYANPRQFVVTGDTTISASFGSKDFYPTGILLNRKKFIRSTFNDGTQLIVRANIAQGDTVELYFIYDNIFWMAPVEQYGAYQNFSGGEAEGHLICNVAGCYDIYFKLEDGLTQSIYIGEGTQCFDGEDWVSPIRITQDVCYLIGKNDNLGAWDLNQAQPINRTGTTLTLPAGMYQFKLLPQNDSWENSYGYSYVYAPCSSGNIAADGDGNIVIALAEEGQVTIAFGDNGICLTGNFVQANTNVHLTTGASPEEAGTVSAESGDYLIETELTLQASISTGGWEFDQWSDGVADNPRTVKLTRDTTITAIFTPGEYGILVNRRQLARGTYTGRLDGSYIAQFKSSVQLQQGDKIQLINLTHNANSTWRPELEEGGLSGNFSIHESDEQKHQSLVCNLSGCYDIYSKIHYGQSSDVLYIGAGEDCQATEYFPIDLTDSITGYSLVGTANLFGTAWDVANTTTDMTLSPTGVYIYTLDSVTLMPDSVYQYKVIANHTWNVDEYPSIEGGDNYYISVQTAGVYSVTFTLVKGERAGAAINFLHEIQTAGCAPISGKCGAEGDSTNVLWELTCDSILFIRGTGAMADYYDLSAGDIGGGMNPDPGLAPRRSNINKSRKALPTGYAPWLTYTQSIKSIRVEEGVTRVGANAFNGCSTTKAVSLPSTLQSIGEYAFNYLISLDTLTCEAVNPPTAESNSFYDVNSAATLHVPAESVSAYQAADGWKSFAKIQAIGSEAQTALSGIYRIGGEAADFASLHEAAEAVRTSGMSGNVTLLVCADLQESANVGLTNTSEYTLTIAPDAAVKRTITFGDAPDNQGPSGHVIIGYPMWDSGAANVWESTDTRNVIIDGSIDGEGQYLEFQAGSVGGVVVVFYGYVTNSVVRNCRLINSRTTSSNYVVQFRSEKNTDKTPVGVGFEKCYMQVTGAANGQAIYFNGSQSATDAGNPTDCYIRNCDINASNRGVLFNGAQNAIFENNVFSVINVSNGFMSHAILGNLQKGTIIVRGNKFIQLVTSNTTAGSYGIQGVTASGGADVWIIENNTFAGMNATAEVSDKAIQLLYVRCGDSCVVRHNTFYMPSLTNKPSTELVASQTIGCVHLAVNKQHIVKNNIFVSAETEAYNSLIRGDLNANVQNNVFYHKGGNAAILAGNTTAMSWDEFTDGDTNIGSVWAEPQFVNVAEGNLAISVGNSNLRMPRLEDVLTDIEGTERAEQTYAGAYEFTGTDESDCTPTSGTCGAQGDNITWSLTCDSVLTISGSGAMANYNGSSEVPWHDYQTAIRTAIISEGVTSLSSSSTFENCTALESVVIPEGITSLGMYTFGDCSSLKAVDLPSTLTSIGSYCFTNCWAIESIICRATTPPEANGSSLSGVNYMIPIYVPAGTTDQYLGADGWSGFTDYREIESGCIIASGECGAQGDNVTWSLSCDSVMYIRGTGAMATYNSNSTKPAPWTEYGPMIRDIIIGEGVTSLSAYGFYNAGSYTNGAYANVHSVSIPSTVSKVVNNNFYQCPLLTVTINSDAIVGQGSYSSSSTLQNIFGVQVRRYIIGDSVKSIASAAFRNQSADSLRSVILPDGITSIGDWAFGYLENMDSISLPSNLQSIGADAFYGSGLKHVEIPAGVTTIGGQAFQNCVQLTSVILPEGLTTIGTNMFFDCNALTEITIPESVQTIGANAFSGYTNLTKATILSPTWVAEDKSTNTTAKQILGSKIRHLIIGEHVTTLGKYAFSEMDSLRIIDLPSGLNVIGEYAFSKCSSLQAATIPDAVTTIGNYAFGDCRMLDSLTLNEGLTRIGTQAFYQCYALRRITLPESLRVIGEKAFYLCTNLTEMTIPSNVDSLGTTPFGSCSIAKMTINSNAICSQNYESTNNLSKNLYQLYAPAYIIGEGVTAIGDFAFSGSGMKSLTLPSTLTQIGNNSFNSCPSLATVTCNALTPPSMQSGSFNNQDTLIVPCEAKSLYKAADYWMNFSTIRCEGDNDLSEKVIGLTHQWTFVMLPGTFGMNADDVTIEGEVEWATYNGSNRAIGKMGWETCDGSTVHTSTNALIVRAKQDTATIIFRVPAQAVSMAEVSLPLYQHTSNHPENANWNFVGNPYPYPYNTTGLQEAGIEAITVWNGTGYDTFSPGIDDYILQPFETFFIQLPDDSAPESLNFLPIYIVQ